MPPDSLHYSSYLHGEIARARAERDLAVAKLILDAAERLVRFLARITTHAPRARP